MTDETKKFGARLGGLVKSALGKKTNGTDDPDVNKGLEAAKFRWFTLISIPQQAQTKTVETFNDEVATWVAQEVPRRADISFLELYLTRNGISRLNREIRIEKNADALVESVSRRLLGEGNANSQGGVEFNPMGLLITPALQNTFDNAFIVRHIEPPQVYSPADESEIPSTVSQYLVGALKIENARGQQVGETPIRALVSADADSDGTQHLSTHVDFDLLLKAFPDEEFSSYPLGINIECRLKLEAGRRRVSQVDLDIHDTKMLARLSELNEKAKLYYYLIEGGNRERQIDDRTDDTYVVNLKSENALRRGTTDSGDSYEIAPGQPVPVSGKVGLQVVLKFTRQDLQHTDSYRFLFRFFRYALRFSTNTNKLSASGQFVRGSGETVIMLPPMFSEGRTEGQSPAFVLRPAEGGGFEISRHSDSPVNVMANGQQIGDEAITIDIDGKTEIEGEIGSAGDSHHEKFRFILRPLTSLMEGRKEVAARRLERGYVAFVEVLSGRTISLAKPEVVLGRNQLLNRRVNVGINALTLTRRYVTWVMSAKSADDVLFYSTVEGRVEQEVRPLLEPAALGVLGTYYVYVDDFEFTILLESTPRTELIFDRSS